MTYQEALTGLLERRQEITEAIDRLRGERAQIDSAIKALDRLTGQTHPHDLTARITDVLRAAGSPLHISDVCAALYPNGCTPHKRRVVGNTLNMGRHRKSPRWWKVAPAMYQAVCVEP